MLTTRAAALRRTHYAWVIVAVAFVGLLTAQGARLSLGAFIRPWQSAFGASRGSISLISTVSFLVYGVTGSYDLALLGGVAVLVLATLTSAALPDPRRPARPAGAVPAPSTA